jgi:hypothetical protein
MRRENAPTYFPNRPLYHNLTLEPQTHQAEMLGEFFDVYESFA